MKLPAITLGTIRTLRIAAALLFAWALGFSTFLFSRMWTFSTIKILIIFTVTGSMTLIIASYFIHLYETVWAKADGRRIESALVWTSVMPLRDYYDMIEGSFIFPSSDQEICDQDCQDSTDIDVVSIPE